MNDRDWVIDQLTCEPKLLLFALHEACDRPIKMKTGQDAVPVGFLRFMKLKNFPNIAELAEDILDAYYAGNLVITDGG